MAHFEPRCEWSDLPVETCAHCQGDDPTIEAGESRRWQDQPRAVRVWPPRAPERDQPATPKAAPEPTTDSRVQAARDLRAIAAMADELGDRAVDLSDDQLMPGGEAMVNLAHVGNLEAWENHEQATERYAEHPDERLRRVYTSAEDEDPDEAWSPFQRLNYWSEQWRRELDMDYGRRPTLTSEALFLANADVLAWAWGNEQGWDDFTEDVKAARTAMENIVRDGIRETRSRVVCDRCTAGRRLIRKWSKGARPDLWKCPACKHEFTEDEAKRAHARQLRSSGAQRWVEQTEAIGALRVQGWQERTVRRWIETLRHNRDRCVVCREKWPAQEYPACPRKVIDRGEVTECGGDLIPLWAGDRDEVVESYCQIGTRRVMLWWPSLWRKHLVATHARDARGA